MKKIMLFLVFLVLFPSSWVSAAFTDAYADVGHRLNYYSFRNEYRLDFGWPTPTNWTKLKVYFETPTNVPFSQIYDQDQVKRKILWLNCNGTYQFFFIDDSGNEIYWTKKMVTTSVSNPVCQSYPDGGEQNDMNADYEEAVGGGYDAKWDEQSGAAEYEIWKDGELIDTVPAGQADYSYHIPTNGSVTIVAKDGSGDVIGQSDIQVPDFDGFSKSACNGCEQILAMLSCPGWNEYMGELSNMINNALSEYFGDVPEPPTAETIGNEIVPDLPVLDTSVPDAAIEMNVPEVFDEPLVFDITSGDVIPVVDGSEPFVINEPTIDSDPVGVMVYPADERNESDGIKEPDTIVTDYEMPTPTIVPAPTEEPEIPESEMPTPSGSGGSGAIPNVPDSEPVPTPTK